MADVVDVVAAELVVDPRALRAVIEVESPGSGLWWEGPRSRVVARLELHLLRRALGSLPDWARIQGRSPWQGHEVRFAAEWEPLHGDQHREWAALDRLVAEGRGEVAYACSSWGAAQILGRHHARVGYASATAMVAAFSEPDEQIWAMGRFIATARGLLAAMRERDWSAFAAEYNGPGQVAAYAAAIGRAYTHQIEIAGTSEGPSDG